jgi:hypothetical protein
MGWEIKNNRLHFMRNEFQLLKESKRAAIFLLFIILAFWAYKIYVNNTVANNGVFIKCIIVSSKVRKGSGWTTTFSYSYKKATYTGITSTSRWFNMGDHLFLKVSTSNPKYFTLIDSALVPDCLIGIQPPSSGWREIPNCK